MRSASAWPLAPPPAIRIERWAITVEASRPRRQASNPIPIQGLADLRMGELLKRRDGFGGCNVARRPLFRKNLGRTEQAPPCDVEAACRIPSYRLSRPARLPL